MKEETVYYHITDATNNIRVTESAFHSVKEAKEYLENVADDLSDTLYEIWHYEYDEYDNPCGVVVDWRSI